MRRVSILPLVVLGLLLAGSPASAGQLPTIDEIITKLNQTEATLITNVRNFRPMVEVYIQNLSPNAQGGLVPTEDSYLLGRFDWRGGPRLQTLSGGKDTPRFLGASRNKDLEYVPDGFAAMAVADWELLGTARYEFKLIRREFLGEARCFVIDVKPRKDMQDGFAGRLWIEDRGYNIVRFNGINRRIERVYFKKKVTFHVDCWRSNVLPGLWLPSYIYVEESDSSDPTAPSQKARFKSNIRLWGYDPQHSQISQQFTSIEINEPTLKDQAVPDAQLSTGQSRQKWEQEAEANVLDRLQKAPLLAFPGEVENVLETVLNNLLVTNDIVLDQPVKARVLLTSPLESFTIGHSIVLSRGMIDVLPDEASLAMMLAHELAHIVLGHPLVNTQFAFADKMMISDEELLKTLKVRRDAKLEAAADAKVMEMLRRSPYKDKLADAGLFLRMIAARSSLLPNLVQPHIGDQITDSGGQVMRLSELMKQSPELAPEKLDQIAALSLGSRLVLDPWTGRLNLLRTVAAPITSAIEKVPLAVTPLQPYLRYAEMPPTADTPTAGGAPPNGATPAR